MKSINKAIKETTPLIIGELISAALVIIGYATAASFTEVDMTAVALGALLGALISVLNYFFLSVSVNRAIDGYLELRGTTPMTDEEAEKFTAEHSMRIQNALRVSFLTRSASIVIALILAFVTEWFSPLATAIPLLLYRPILTLSELLRNKLNPTQKATEREPLADGATESVGEPSEAKEDISKDISNTTNTKDGDE